MDQMIDSFLKAVIDIATPILAGLVVAVLSKLLQRLHLTVQAEQRAKLEAYARIAILHAEEWAAARIRAQVPTDAGSKFEMALASVLDYVPGVTREDASKVIHAQLPELGLGATGFLQAVRMIAPAPAK